MNIQLVKRKASSRKDIAKQCYVIPNSNTLRELLLNITEIEYHHLYDSKKDFMPLSKNEIEAQQHQGKIIFQSTYDTQKEALEKAFTTVLQDFKDGIFRVFVRQNEITDLDEELHLQENDEVVFIKLVMLAGRLW